MKTTGLGSVSPGCHCNRTAPTAFWLPSMCTAVRRSGLKWRSTGAEVSVVLNMLNAVSHSTDHVILRVSEPDAFNKSVRGAAISEKDGMKVRKKCAIPKNERRCFTVSGAGHSTTADTLDSVGDQTSAEILNPKNST